MSIEAFEELNKNYNDVQNACRDYLEAENEFNQFEKSRKGIIKDISYVLNKDIGVLEKCDPMEPGTLSEIIGKSRSHTIVLKGDDIKTMGAVLSTRIPLKTPNGKKGFFTPKSVYNQDKEWAARIDKHLDRLGAFSANYKKNMEMLKTDEEAIGVFCSVCPPLPIKQYLERVKNEEMAERQVIAVARMLGIGVGNKDAKDLLKDVNLKQAVFDFIADMSRMVNKYEIMKAGISNVKFRLEHMIDGKIKMESESGKGTTVTITIPYVNM